MVASSDICIYDSRYSFNALKGALREVQSPSNHNETNLTSAFLCSLYCASLTKRDIDELQNMCLQLAPLIRCLQL